MSDMEKTAFPLLMVTAGYFLIHMSSLITILTGFLVRDSTIFIQKWWKMPLNSMN